MILPSRKLTSFRLLAFLFASVIGTTVVPVKASAHQRSSHNFIEATQQLKQALLKRKVCEGRFNPLLAPSILFGVSKAITSQTSKFTLVSLDLSTGWSHSAVLIGRCNNVIQCASGEFTLTEAERFTTSVADLDKLLGANRSQCDPDQNCIAPMDQQIKYTVYSHSVRRCSAQVIAYYNGMYISAIKVVLGGHVG